MDGMSVLPVTEQKLSPNIWTRGGVRPCFSVWTWPEPDSHQNILSKSSGVTILESRVVPGHTPRPNPITSFSQLCLPKNPLKWHKNINGNDFLKVHFQYLIWIKSYLILLRRKEKSLKDGSLETESRSFFTSVRLLQKIVHIRCSQLLEVLWMPRCLLDLLVYSIFISAVGRVLLVIISLLFFTIVYIRRFCCCIQTWASPRVMTKQE